MIKFGNKDTVSLYPIDLSHSLHFLAPHISFSILCMMILMYWKEMPMTSRLRSEKESCHENTGMEQGSSYNLFVNIVSKYSINKISMETIALAMEAMTLGDREKCDVEMVQRCKTILGRHFGEKREKKEVQNKAEERCHIEQGSIVNLQMEGT